MVPTNQTHQSDQDFAELEKLKLQLEIGNLKKGWTKRPSSWIAIATAVIAVSGFIIEMQLNRVQIARADLELQEKNTEIKEKIVEIDVSRKKLAQARDELLNAEKSKRAEQKAVRELEAKKHQLEARLFKLENAITEAVKLNTVEEVRKRLKAVDFEVSSRELRAFFSSSELTRLEQGIAEQIEHTIFNRLEYDIENRENVTIRVRLVENYSSGRSVGEELLQVHLETIDGRTSESFRFSYSRPEDFVIFGISPEILVGRVIAAFHREFDEGQLSKWFARACAELDIVIHTRKSDETPWQILLEQ
jgi:hypothetical protein